MLAFLRSDLGLTAVKRDAGGCVRRVSVLADGVPVLACQIRAGDVAGRSVTAIEELAGSAGGVSPGDVNLIRHVLPLAGRR